MSVEALKQLEQRLVALSHDESAIEVIRDFSAGLKNTKGRLEVFNADNALIRSPILMQETEALGYILPEDAFALLQGDVVGTESAFFFGERLTGIPKYIVLNSSCDVVQDRRKCAALLRVTEIRESEQRAKEALNLLLRFSRTDSMYLPALPSDRDDVLCNAIEFDGICQIRSCDLMLANRIASMSLVGWRIFGSFARTVIARTTPRECDMRKAVESRPEQRLLNAIFGNPE